MASGSSSPASDVSSGISASASPIFNMSDDDQFKQDRNLVLGLPAVASGGDKDSTTESAGGEVAANGEQMCIGRNNDWVILGYCTDQGARKYMEDRYLIYPAFLSLRCNTFGGCTAPQCQFASEPSPVHYFAVFDGHGGSQVSEYCTDAMHKALKEAWETEGCANIWNMKWHSAFYRAYESVNKTCEEESNAGSTAVVVLLSPCQIVAANCGDSRAVLCRGSHTIPLTNDHKPDRRDEEERIIKSGGRVLSDSWGTPRVNGVLAMSRAIGDRTLKPSVSSVPELTFTTRSEDDECLIIATDGLWDVMSSEYAGNLACELLQQERQVERINKSPSQYVAECLLNEARWRSSSDNCCVIVVDLKAT